MAFMAPLAVAGMALAAAGTAANMVAQKKQQAAMKERMAETRADTRRLQSQSSAEFQKALAEADPARQKQMLAERAAQSQNLYEATTADVADTTTAQPSAEAPKVVKTAMAQQLGDKLAQAKAQMAAAANLSGWGSTQYDRGLELKRTGEKIDMLSSFMGGGARASQLDLQALSQAKPKVPLGDILMGLGSAASAAGGGGMGAATGAMGSMGTWATTPMNKYVSSSDFKAAMPQMW